MGLVLALFMLAPAIGFAEVKSGGSAVVDAHGNAVQTTNEGATAHDESGAHGEGTHGEDHSSGGLPQTGYNNLGCARLLARCYLYFDVYLLF